MPEPLGESQDSRSSPPPRRRRWQFSLATLLIVVTIAAVIARWMAQPEQWHKFQQRFEAAVEEHGGEVLWGNEGEPHFVSFEYSAVRAKALNDEDFKRLRHDLARLAPLSLNLRRCDVTDASLAELAKLRHLECLCLVDTPIADVEIDHLCRMEGLQFVDVTGSPITADGIARLRARRPELVVWSSGDRDQSIAAAAKWGPGFSDEDISRSLHLDDDRGRLIATLGKYRLDFPQFLTPTGGRPKVLPLPCGDAIAFAYHDTSDSGVDLARLLITDQRAKIAWTARSEPLRVEHSNYSYYRHDVTLRLHGDKLLVHSAGLPGTYLGELRHPEIGTFVELRDLDTGALVKRWRY
jgi:hypothetical protein